MAVMLPSRAHAGIFDIFGELFGTIQNDMGAALSQINALTQEMQQLHQQIVWPLALVNQARGFVSNSINSYRGFMTQVFTLKSPSATLASPQQLETILHSRQSAQIPALQASFADELRDSAGGERGLSTGPGDDGHRRCLGPAEFEDDTHC